MTAAVSLDVRAAVAELVARSAWALDTGDEAGFAACFTPDGSLERRHRDGASEVYRGGDALRTFARLTRGARTGEDAQTWATDLLVRTLPDGRVAATWSSLTVDSVSAGLSNTLLFDGRVDDVLVRDGSVWSIQERTITPLGADAPLIEIPDERAPAGPTPDRIEIEALFADYAWALDTADTERVVELFSSDAAIQDPFGRYEGQGPDGIRVFFEHLFGRPEFAGRMHWVSQIVADTAVATDHAVVDSYALVPAAHRGASNIHLLAFYRDDLVREDGCWRFRDRKVGPRWPSRQAEAEGITD
ncbi:nuclear transport factor 2 family protein [Microbacterium sp.]|uniref:nuclear transport factor 2 family protein n=1 Tax=Microbacterium sp. TaxID=51671 RepID=UPI000928F3D8|nr:nuclear transport factor 2 family protein [Microbacterium sp.]MBN9192020.1 nuclear transport factor 2 family protein [Microbacterium sp.]OJU58279.1 MAG: hypothetical protein BGO04_02055 [Microbacterium sp. 70-38]